MVLLIYFGCGYSKYIISEVEEIRMEMDDIKVKGKNCPRPIHSWAQAGVQRKLLDSLKK